MNITFFRHLSDSRYCFSLDESHLLLRIAVSKYYPVEDLEVIFGDQASFYNNHRPQRMELKYEDNAFYYYETVINLFPMRVIYIFRYKNEGKEYYLCENDIYESFDYSLSFLSAFQYNGENYNDFIKESPSWEGRVIYQIFPERFNYRNNFLDKSYVSKPWNAAPLHPYHKDYLGGDLYGIIDKLDYLKDLGVGAIYLTPIHPSPSYHKYDVVDYYDIDHMFGGKEAFKELVNEAHKRDIKVMMDLVYNHCSNQNPLFLDVVEKGYESKYHDWFFINGDRPKRNPNNYLSFANVSTMPKLNTNNKEVQNYLIDVSRYWVNEFQVDGYRLDVSEGVSHDFWNRFKIALTELKDDILIIGENWLNSESYLGNNQIDGVVNYPFLSALSSYLLQKKNAKEASLHLQQLLMRYKDGHNRKMFNIFGSHDIQRVMNLVHDKDLALLGYAVMVFYLGYPMIYYGDEIFMEGGGDPDNRRGMRWDSEEFSSYRHEVFKQLLHLRKERPLAVGDIAFNSDDNLLVIKRYKGGQAYRLISNMSDNEYHIEGNIVLSNRFEYGMLKPHGFVVVKE